MRLLVHLVLLLALSGVGVGQSILIHPFTSDDSVLGTVVADRVAGALRPGADLVIGPAAAPSLVPPFPYGDGFITPLAVLESDGIARLHGAMLLRAGTGVDLAASGRIVPDADGLRLDLVAALADGSTVATTLRAPEDRPEVLARRAAALLAHRLGAPAPEPPAPIDLAGADDAVGRTLTLLAAGLADEAESVIAAAEEADADTPRLRELSDALTAVREGRPADDPALGASLALTVLADDERTMSHMERLAATGLPAGDAWIGAIAASVNDLARADDAYGRAAAAYPYGRAAAAGYARSHERSGADRELAELAGGSDPAALAAVALLAELAEDPATGTRALRALGSAAPTFTWPFERLSFLAFDADDPLAAVRALAVATELDPDNDLYWTNLGWAWYLLGLWDRSEAASERALDLAPDAHIAGYNLGLVRARAGRLADAMPAYEAAITIDPEVDDEALRDVETALQEVPGEPALHYVLGRLYEAEGRRDAAADAYEAFLELGGRGDPFDDRAGDRVEALRAPPPPLQIAGGLEARLGGADAPSPWHPGDPVGLRFEVVTPGDALPRALRANATLRAADGATVHAESLEVEVPQDAIGYVIDDLRLELPADLPAGDYELQVDVAGLEEQSARAETRLRVEGEPSVLRRLVGRGVTLTSLSAGRPLYEPADVAREESVMARLVGELRSASEVAGEVLPTIEEGRFAGLGGAELFEAGDETDVRAFLDYLLDGEVRDVRITFVDAFAQWALEGAPGR